MDYSPATGDVSAGRDRQPGPQEERGRTSQVLGAPPGCEDAEFLGPGSHLPQLHLPRCHTPLSKPSAQPPAFPCCGHKREVFLCRVLPTPATCFRPVGRWSRGGRDPCSTSARPGPAIDQTCHASSSALIGAFPGLIHPPGKRGGFPPPVALLTPTDLNLRLLTPTLPLQRVERADRLS